MSSKTPPFLVGCFGPDSAVNEIPAVRTSDNLTLARFSAGGSGLLLATHFKLKEVLPNSFSWSVSGLDNESDLAVQLSEDRLKLSRGRFGRISFFTAKTGNLLWFSTRLDVLIRWSGLHPEINTSHLRIFTTYSWFPAPCTPYAEIKALKPGEEFSFSTTTSSSTLSDSWGTGSQPEPDNNRAASTLEKMLLEETERQAIDLHGQTAGVLLSGGLDSSLTAAALARIGMRVHAYCLDFGDYARTEIEYAEAVAAHLRIPLRLVPCGPEEVWSALPETISAMDIPYGDGVTVPLFIASRELSRDCQVLFNGEGGDQLFAGWANKPMVADSVYGSHRGLLESYMLTFHRFREAGSAALADDPNGSSLADEIQAAVGDALDESFTGEALLHRLRRANLRLKGAQNIQPRATSAGLANGLSVRSLFCSDSIADWTFGLAPSCFLHNSHEKYILKQAVRDWLPDKVVWREKRGMGVPTTAWLTGPLWRRLGAFLHPRIISRRGLWQSETPLRLATGRLGAPFQGRRIGELLWLLLSLQIWLDDRSLRLSPFVLPASVWRALSSASPEAAERLWNSF